MGNVWCDDHTCVEFDITTRCFDDILSLRKVMATIPGPPAINEQNKKNSTMEHRRQVAGSLVEHLNWDSINSSRLRL